jgi:hypothetical protein
MALSSTELQLNRIAQGLLPISEGIAWFDALAQDEQEAVLRTLAYITSQSHPLANEVEPAMAQAGLKSTFTPCVVVLKAPLPEKGCQRLPGLPRDEWLKSFRLMIALFALADRRRRETSCRNGCTHDWHNLANYAH